MAARRVHVGYIWVAFSHCHSLDWGSHPRSAGLFVFRVRAALPVIVNGEGGVCRYDSISGRLTNDVVELWTAAAMRGVRCGGGHEIPWRGFFRARGTM